LARLSGRLDPSHHLLAVVRECVVDNGFGRDDFVVVIEPEMPEDRLQPAASGWLQCELVVSAQNDCLVARP
jgi:hypothetical protein